MSHIYIISKKKVFDLSSKIHQVRPYNIELRLNFSTFIRPFFDLSLQTIEDDPLLMYDIETDFENTFENSEFEQNSRTNEFEPSSRSFSDSRDGEEETEVVEELRKTVDLLKVSYRKIRPFEG
jgi:hypothetical protein